MVQFGGIGPLSGHAGGVGEFSLRVPLLPPPFLDNPVVLPKLSNFEEEEENIDSALEGDCDFPVLFFVGGLDEF